MQREQRKRRMFAAVIVAIISIAIIAVHPDMQQPAVSPPEAPQTVESSEAGNAAEALEKILVKGRAPKTGYERSQFGGGWKVDGGCDMRNIILRRDLKDTRTDDGGCKVLSGILNDPYTGNVVNFVRGTDSSGDVQIDHVVALSNAWQTGAQALTYNQREQFANDPLELLAVDGPANQQKSDADAASWLPSNKAFRCQFIARQIAIKAKYRLWVTLSEKEAMSRVLSACPGQGLPQE